MSDQDKTKEKYVVDFIKAFDENERAMEPFKEHRRDLRKNYVENGWLSKDEMKQAVRAYRMLQQDEDFSTLQDIYDRLRTSLGVF
jgi:hypothetical protein|tara:strand:+ start:2345 stop:2599 length:255 start_codon:yes stop_codon:yes gene_type:complete